jgi:hypothetical protein
VEQQLGIGGEIRDRLVGGQRLITSLGTAVYMTSAPSRGSADSTHLERGWGEWDDRENGCIKLLWILH